MLKNTLVNLETFGRNFWCTSLRQRDKQYPIIFYKIKKKSPNYYYGFKKFACQNYPNIMATNLAPLIQLCTRTIRRSRKPKLYNYIFSKIFLNFTRKGPIISPFCVNEQLIQSSYIWYNIMWVKLWQIIFVGNNVRSPILCILDNLY